MIETTTTDIVAGSQVLKPITADMAKAAMNLALTKVGKSFQALENKVSAIVPNEDNLQAMADVIKEADLMEKEIEKAFKEGKKPYWDAATAYDAAKKDLMGLKTAAIKKTEEKYAELCRAIEQRRKDAEEKEKKDKAIIDGIATNVLAFSAKITACKTNEELTAVEKLINLEKSRATKYGEFLPILVERCNELNALVKTQKATVQQLEAIQAEKVAAEASGDDGKLLDLMDKEELLTQTVQQNKINIEEKVVNTATSYSHVTTAKEVFPEIKGGRRQWKMKIVDEAKAYKNGMLTVEINSAKAKLEMANLREGNKNAAEFFSNGLHYYEEKNF